MILLINERLNLNEEIRLSKFSKNEFRLIKNEKDINVDSFVYPVLLSFEGFDYLYDDLYLNGYIIEGINEELDRVYIKDKFNVIPYLDDLFEIIKNNNNLCVQKISYLNELFKYNDIPMYFFKSNEREIYEICIDGFYCNNIVESIKLIVKLKDEFSEHIFRELINQIDIIFSKYIISNKEDLRELIKLGDDSGLYNIGALSKQLEYELECDKNELPF